MRQYIGLTAALAGVTWWTLDPSPASPADPPRIDHPQASPHWTVGGCSACHDVAADNVKPIPRDAIDANCLRCHNGIDASSEPHPIGRPAAGDQVRHPDGWPVIDGKLSCITCHDVLRACRTDGTRPTRGRNMLRGPADRSQFCATCHVAPLHERFNPHRMTHHDGRVNHDACLHCHQPDIAGRTFERRTGQGRLVGDEITLCGACHGEHVDYFEPGHIGVAASATVLGSMARTLVELPGGRSVSAADLMPLSPDGRVVCSTCHNPHPRGVFPERGVLAHQAMDPRGSGGLRITESKLCLGCHAP